MIISFFFLLLSLSFTLSFGYTHRVREKEKRLHRHIDTNTPFIQRLYPKSLEPEIRHEIGILYEFGCLNYYIIGKLRWKINWKTFPVATTLEFIVKQKEIHFSREPFSFWHVGPENVFSLIFSLTIFKIVILIDWAQTFRLWMVSLRAKENDHRRCDGHSAVHWIKAR